MPREVKVDIMAIKHFEVWVQVIEHTNIGTRQHRKLVSGRMGKAQADFVAEKLRDEIARNVNVKGECEEEKMVTDFDHLQSVQSVQSEVSHATR